MHHIKDENGTLITDRVQIANTLGAAIETRQRRKYASALPSTFTSTRSPDNAQKPQIWPISAKGSP